MLRSLSVILSTEYNSLLTPAEVCGDICKSLDLFDSGFVCELLHYHPVSIGNVAQPVVSKSTNSDNLESTFS